MTEQSPVDRAKQAGDTLQRILLRSLATVIVLVIFAGLAFLVYRGRMNADALLLYAGVILGYVLHAVRQAV